MSWIWNVLTGTYKIMAAMPFIPFLIVYYVGVMRGRQKKDAIRLAMDVTTIFLIGIVSALLSTRTGSSLGFFVILLVMLVGAGLIGNAQTRVRGAIDPRRIFRAVWRLSFFAMAVLYLLLMTLQLIFPASAHS